MDFKGSVKKKVEFSDGEPSPRGVLENPALLGTESDHSGSSSSSTCSLSPNEKSIAHQALENQGMQWKSMFGALKKKSVRRFSTIPLLAAGYEISRKNLRRKLARIGSSDRKIDDCEGFPDLVGSKPTWRNFDCAELAVATSNFSSGKNIKNANPERFTILILTQIMSFMKFKFPYAILLSVFTRVRLVQNQDLSWPRGSFTILILWVHAC